MLTFPAWDCLPYDRASPALRVMAERLATLQALQVPSKQPQLLIVTANALTQRVLTPFRIRALDAAAGRGRADRARRAGQIAARPMATSAPTRSHDAGEFAVRGSIVDLFPAGESTALRLDFFGDEIETMRRFDPADQRIDRGDRRLHADAGVRSLARRGEHQALPRALSRDLRRQCDRRPALPGGQRGAAAGGDGALAAVVRGEAGDAVRASRRA